MRFFPDGICATSWRMISKANFEKELLADNELCTTIPQKIMLILYQKM